jgi:barstar (barnase inhibitor)
VSKLLERLKDPARSGVYRAGTTKDLEQVTAGSGLDIVPIETAGDPVAAIARAFGFPSWFGANWDALEDSLSDLSWRERDGYVLLVLNYPDGDSLRSLTDVLRSVAKNWAQRGKPFFAVFIDAQKKLALPDLYRGA